MRLFFKRYLKYKNWEELEEGNHFSIIEINGAMSGPSHIYDPKHNYFWGIKEIMRHHNIMCEISIYNKSLGVNYLPFKKGIKEFKQHFETISNFNIVR